MTFVDWAYFCNGQPTLADTRYRARLGLLPALAPCARSRYFRRGKSNGLTQSYSSTLFRPRVFQNYPWPILTYQEPVCQYLNTPKLKAILPHERLIYKKPPEVQAPEAQRPIRFSTLALLPNLCYFRSARFSSPEVQRISQFSGRNRTCDLLFSLLRNFY